MLHDDLTSGLLTITHTMAPLWAMWPIATIFLKIVQNKNFSSISYDAKGSGLIPAHYDVFLRCTFYFKEKKICFFHDNTAAPA